MSRRRARLSPLDDARSYILSSRDKPCFQEKFINTYKGRGVFAIEHVDRGAFVLEYRGELITKEESTLRQKRYSESENTFLFDFISDRHWCVDASKEDGSLGRLVNDHHRSPNCKIKRILVQEKPHLCLFAIDDIEAGSEITYNYGDSNWPWRELAIDKPHPATAVEIVGLGQSSNCTPGVLIGVPSPSTQAIDKPHPATAVEIVGLGQSSNCTPGVLIGVPSPSTQAIDKPHPATAVEIVGLGQSSNCTPGVLIGVPSPSTQAIDKPHPATAVEIVGLGQSSNCTPGVLIGVPSPSTQAIDKPHPATAVEIVGLGQSSNCTPGVLIGVPSPSTQAIDKPHPATAVEIVGLGQSSNCTPGVLIGVPSPSTQAIDKPHPATAVEIVGLGQSSNCTPGVLIGVPSPSTQAIDKPHPATAVEIVGLGQSSNCTPGVLIGVPSPSTQAIDKPHPATAVEIVGLGQSSNCTPGVLIGVPSPSTQAIDKPHPATAVEIVGLGQSSNCTPGVLIGVPSPSTQALVTYSDTDQSEDSDSMKAQAHLVVLRRTKSILEHDVCWKKIMQRIPVDSDELYDSSGDEQVTSTSDNPGNLPHYTVGQRLRRTNSLPVNVMMPVGSDQDENSSPDSEEEYIPKSSGESSDSCMSLEIPLQKSSKKKRSLCERNSYLPQKRIHSQSSPQNQLDTTTHLQGEDDTGYQNLEESTTVSQRGSVSVCPVSKKANGLRRYNKMQYCIYCKLGTQKMARHLERKHSEESPVAKLRLLPKNSKERRILLDSLRKRGNFAHNVEVLESGKGKLVPCKQPQVEKKGQDFMHCLYCQGLFLRRILWRHVRVCKFKPDNMNSKPGKSRVQTLCAYTQPPSGFSDGYWKLLNKMNHDPISDAIRKDGCILAYGQRLFESKGHQVNHHEYIRQALRELGRLALKLKDVTPLKTTEELFKPTNYIHAVTAVKHTAGFNHEAGQYGCPSLARKLGHSLHSMSLWLKSEAQMKGQKETAVEAHEFSELYKQRWTDDITSRALSQLEQAKWNSPHILPFTEDVKTLHCYLDEKQEQLINSMKKQLSSLTWRDLTKVTLAQIILFNRRREGEVSRMPLSAFVLRDTSDPHQDVNLALSTLEQKLCRHFNRIEIRGKRGRKVPLLLTPAMKESIELLVEKREECGVLKENTYLFAVPGSMFNYRGSDCLRQFVKDCNIKNPMSLTSTKLRKHVATLSKVLNLKDTELDQLADFLGHDVRVHRQYYRLPEGTLQLAKMSKILMALEQGRLGEFKGKSLDDIHIDPNEEIEVDEEPEENEESEDECGNKDSTADVNTPMTPKSTQGGNSDKPCEVLSDVNPQKTGRKPFQRRPWQKEEIDAVEKHMKNLILTCQVPGKSDCDRCLKLEPEALKNRDWRAIKFYLKNRITALKKNV